MKDNERVINSRMQKMAEERNLMEDKLNRAAITMQRHARGMNARNAYKKQMEE